MLRARVILTACLVLLVAPIAPAQRIIQPHEGDIHLHVVPKAAPAGYTVGTLDAYDSCDGVRNLGSGGPDAFVVGNAVDIVLGMALKTGDLRSPPHS